MKQKKKNFDYFSEIIGWISIAVSPLLISCLLGLLIYRFQPNQVGVALACLLLIGGLLVGIIWATSIWKKGGTIHFLSKLISSSPSHKKEESDQ